MEPVMVLGSANMLSAAQANIVAARCGIIAHGNNDGFAFFAAKRHFPPNDIAGNGTSTRANLREAQWLLLICPFCARLIRVR